MLGPGILGDALQPGAHEVNAMHADWAGNREAVAVGWQPCVRLVSGINTNDERRTQPEIIRC